MRMAARTSNELPNRTNGKAPPLNRQPKLRCLELTPREIPDSRHVAPSIFSSARTLTCHRPYPPSRDWTASPRSHPLLPKCCPCRKSATVRRPHRFSIAETQATIWPLLFRSWHLWVPPRPPLGKFGTTMAAVSYFQSADPKPGHPWSP